MYDYCEFCLFLFKKYEVLQYMFTFLFIAHKISYRINNNEKVDELIKCRSIKNNSRVKNYSNFIKILLTIVIGSSYYANRYKILV